MPDPINLPMTYSPEMMQYLIQRMMDMQSAGSGISDQLSEVELQRDYWRHKARLFAVRFCLASEGLSARQTRQLVSLETFTEKCLRSIETAMDAQGVDVPNDKMLEALGVE